MILRNKRWLRQRPDSQFMTLVFFFGVRDVMKLQGIWPQKWENDLVAFRSPLDFSRDARNARKVEAIRQGVKANERIIANTKSRDSIASDAGT